MFVYKNFMILRIIMILVLALNYSVTKSAEFIDGCENFDEELMKELQAMSHVALVMRISGGLGDDNYTIHMVESEEELPLPFDIREEIREIFPRFEGESKLLVLKSIKGDFEPIISISNTASHQKLQLGNLSLIITNSSDSSERINSISFLMEAIIIEYSLAYNQEYDIKLNDIFGKVVDSTICLS